MTKDEFAILKQNVNELAKKYANHEGGLIELREKIWLSLWEMRPVIFHTNKDIRGYLNFSLSSLYETGEEFLTEVFQEAIPQALESYAKKIRNSTELFPFLRFFEQCFCTKVQDARREILDKESNNLIVIREPVVQAYKEPRMDAIMPGTFLKKGMTRRILGRVYDGEQEWIKTNLGKHKLAVYVREAEIDIYDNNTNVDINNIVEPEDPEQPDDPILISDTYENYILALLSLVEQLYARTQTHNDKGLNKKYCFRLLYTETLIYRLKRVIDAIGNVQTVREQEALSVAEVELLDYLLTDICRTFSSIAATPLRALRDFAYLNTDSTEKIRIPVANIVYAHFLVDIKGIDRKLNSIGPSLSKYRAEFNKQYNLIAEQI